MSGNLKREDRKEQVLRAAMRCFAKTGYFGTTTAEIAREAGISQGYVVQLFGTKAALFLAVLERAGEAIVSQMRGVNLRSLNFRDFDDVHGPDALDETETFVLMQGFATASVPEVGTYVRSLLAEMHQVIVEREQMTVEEARDYLARGLLFNTVLAMGYREHATEYPWIASLIQSTRDDSVSVL